MRVLVDAGVLPQTRMAGADKSVADEIDEAILRRTLYGSLNVQDLTEEQAVEMTGAAQRLMDRKHARLDYVQKLVDMGAVPRRALDSLREDLSRARETVDQAANRAALLKEIAGMARAEQEAAEAEPDDGPKPIYERYTGTGVFRDADLRRIVLDFEREFERALPISARGETALHRSLGFNHRGRVDVAIDPDHAEGRWLRALLEKLRIPYYAFRGSVRGKSTGPHIHIGPPSERLHLGG
jgi:hypothetical protein